MISARDVASERLERDGELPVGLVPVRRTSFRPSTHRYFIENDEKSTRKMVTLTVHTIGKGALTVEVAKTREETTVKDVKEAIAAQKPKVRRNIDILPSYLISDELN